MPDKVLVVDDDPGMLDLCRIALTESGIGTITTLRGEEAVEIFRSRQDEIGLIMVDYAMTGMNGIETSAALRKIQAGVNIMSVTGTKDEQVLALLEEMGLTPILAKPFGLEQLIDVVKSQLS